MTVYIKREDAIDAVLDVYYNTPDIDLSGERLEAAILNIPAADVMEVVRCRECLCYTPVDDNIGKCVFLTGKHQYVVPDGYCYLEELKEGAGND